MLSLRDADDEVSEEELVARVRQGDRCAFDRLIEQHAEGLLRIAYGYVKSRADAQDISQDVFFWIWRERETWHPLGSVGSYLALAVRRRALNVLKHRKVEAGYEERIMTESSHDITIASTAPADTTIVADDEQASAWQLLDRLPDRSKMALLLRYGQEMSFADVATAMGISVPAARQLAKRALDQLRAAYRV